MAKEIKKATIASTQPIDQSKLARRPDELIGIRPSRQTVVFNGKNYLLTDESGTLNIEGAIDLLIDSGINTIEGNDRLTKWLNTIGVDTAPIVKKDGSINNALLIDAIKENPKVLKKFLSTYEKELEITLGKNVNAEFDTIRIKGKDYRFIDENGNLIVDDIIDALINESPSLFKDNEKFTRLLTNLGIEKEPIVRSDGSIDSQRLTAAIQKKPTVFSRFLKDNEKAIEQMLGRNINLSFDSLKFKGKDYQFIDSKGNLILDDIFDALIDNGYLDIGKNKKFSDLLKTWNIEIDKIFKKDGTFDKDALLNKIKEKPRDFLDFIRIKEDELKNLLGRNFYEDFRLKWRDNKFWGSIVLTPDPELPGFVSPKPIPLPLPSPDLSESQKKLLDIKGVDKKRVQTLSELGIDSTSDLLVQCRTIEQRQLLAYKMLILEKKVPLEEGVAIKQSAVSNYYSDITYWVKQVDLWRINSMDPDTADFLVHMGVRFVEDVKKLDLDKTYSVMQSLARNSTQYKLATKERLAKLIKNAKAMVSRILPIRQKFEASLAESLAPITNILSSLRAKGNVRDIRAVIEALGKIKEHPSLDVLFYSLEIDEPAPEYLFVEDNHLDNSIVEESVNSIEIIAKGLGFLRGVEAEMPLPKKLRGRAYFLKDDQFLPVSEDKTKEAEERKAFAMTKALVELDGIVDPSVDEANAPKPSAYTDGNGEFVINLPNGYNLKNSITVTISKGEGNNRGVMSFVASASDILNGVDSEKVSRFKILNSLVNIFDEIRKCGQDGKKIKSFNDIETFVDEYNSETASDDQKKIKNLCDSFNEEKASLDNYDSSKVYESINELLTEPNWESVLPDYIVYESAFLNREKENKLLPSVKFMENNGHSIYLPTDTAPSEIYSYSMLQRLVEPGISPVENINKPRVTLKNAIDTSSFKDKLISDPNSIPHMSTLGIGYSLNMHQAWVPDGFALGNLLYSTILAPGEEQRLIVREKQENYQITDQQTGTDSTSEDYASSQNQLTTQAYQLAIDEMMNGGSSFNYASSTKSHSSSSGILGGLFGGGSSGRSESEGSSRSSSFQKNNYNEASNAASRFQNNIKASSEKISQARRLLIKTASSNETDSVSTRIIANHNHSHAMTIQYWEVMRRYRLETCIDNVDLVLFVPLELINFLPKSNNNIFSQYSLQIAKENITSQFNKENFNFRYQKILEYYDVIQNFVPRKYRSGLNLIKKFAALPYWNVQKITDSCSTYELTIKGGFCEFDNLTTTIYFNNGSTPVQGILKKMDINKLTLEDINYDTQKRRIKTPHTRKECIQAIINARNSNKTEAKFSFTLPYGCSPDDISQISIKNNISAWKYTLSQDTEDMETWEAKAVENYEHKLKDLYKDADSSGNDINKINHYAPGLPECYTNPIVTFSASELYSLGVLEITVSEPDTGSTGSDTNTGIIASGVLKSYTFYAYKENRCPNLRLTDIQKIEETFHHIVSNTMRYSQAVWNNMTSNERALMLEQYTIDMNFEDIEGDASEDNVTFDDIPLLNCIDVHKMMGFYGNCMIFPFTYPEKLAERLGKTAYELQDALYRYHTYHFRVPTTVISLPTDGMVGEAVLGETNVSEKIDITRFWNWKDSPIDKMEKLDNNYLNNADYLADKNTTAITPLNISSATAPTNINVPDLLKALQEKQISFNDLSGLNQLQEVMNRGTQASETALTESMKLTQSSMDNAVKAAEVVGNIVTQCMGISGTNDLKNTILNKLTGDTGGEDENKGSGDTNGTGGEDSSSKESDSGSKGSDSGSKGSNSGSKGIASVLTPEVITALLGSTASSSKSSDKKKSEEKKEEV